MIERPLQIALISIGRVGYGRENNRARPDVGPGACSESNSADASGNWSSYLTPACEHLNHSLTRSLLAGPLDSLGLLVSSNGLPALGMEALSGRSLLLRRSPRLRTVSYLDLILRGERQVAGKMSSPRKIAVDLTEWNR